MIKITLPSSPNLEHANFEPKNDQVGMQRELHSDNSIFDSQPKDKITHQLNFASALK